MQSAQALTFGPGHSRGMSTSPILRKISQQVHHVGFEKRLHDEDVHARGEEIRPHIRTVIARQHDDGEIRPDPAADFPGRIEPVHIRHFPVQDDREVVVPFLMGAHNLGDGFLPAQDPKSPHPHFLEQQARVFADIPFVIHHKHGKIGQNRGFPVFGIPEFQRNAHRKPAPFSQRAVHGDLAVHHMDDVLADRHAKARSLDFADPGILGPGKRFEDAPDELLGHADPVVFKRKVEDTGPFGMGWLFLNAEMQTPALRGILHGVRQDVHQNLLEAALIPIQALVPHLADVHGQVMPLFNDHRPAHVEHVLHQIGKAEIVRPHIQASALDFGHIQNFVDQIEQMFAGRIDLLEAVPHFLGILNMGARNRRHPHNGVHGGPDVMGHPGKKFRLSLVGVLRHPTGVFQRLLLEPLPLDRFRHVNAQAVVGRYPILAVLPVHIAERNGQVTDFSRPGHDPALHDAAPPRFLRLVHRRLGLLHILRMNIQALALQLFFKLLFRVADDRQEFRTIPEDCAFIARVEPGDASRKAPQHRRLLFSLLVQFVLVLGDIKNELDSGFPPVPQYLPIFQEIRFPQLLVIMLPLIKS